MGYHSLAAGSDSIKKAIRRLSGASKQRNNQKSAKLSKREIKERLEIKVREKIDTFVDREIELEENQE